MDSNQIIALVQNLPRLRTIHGIKQEEIAINIQVSIGTYSRWESTNFKSTKVSDLVKLLTYLESRGVKFSK